MYLRHSQLYRILFTCGLLWFLNLPTISAEAPQSHVINPGFEMDADKDGAPDRWGFIAGERGRGSLSLDKGHTGKFCAKVVCEELGGRWGPGVGQVGTVAVEKGKWYRVSFWAKSSEIGQLTVGLHDTANWKHGGLWNTVALQEDWSRHEVVFQATKTYSRTTRLQFGVNEEGAVWIDDVLFEPAAPPRNKNLLDIEGAKNYVPNASFEVGTFGWGTWGADKLYGEIDDATAAHGERSFRIELSPDKFPVYYNDFTYVKHGAPTHGPVRSLPVANVGWFPLEKGGAYALSVWLKADRPGLTARAEVIQWPTDVTSKEFVVNTDWKRFHFSFGAKGDSGFVKVGADLDKSNAEGATLWIDGVQLERGDRPTAFQTKRPVEMGLATNVPGNIFHVGDEIRFRLRLYNDSEREERITLTQSITDFFDKGVWGGELSFTAPAKAAVSQKLAPPLREPGFYRLHLNLRGDGFSQERSVRFAVVFPYSKSYPGVDSQFGINHAFISDYFMRLARDAGITWVRSWFLKWEDVEREKGRFDFSEADIQLNRLRRLDMNVHVCLATPSSRWASTAPAALTGTTGAEAELRRHWWIPQSFDDYENYVYRCVEHCKDRCKHWEVFNEPTDAKGGPDSNLDLATNYIRFLMRARAGAKRADPSSFVLGAGYHYIKNAIENQGALGQMDIISEHAYPGLARASSWQRHWDDLAAKFDAAGGRKQIWLTEYGIYADDDPDPSTATSRFLVHLGSDSERTAATHVVKHYVVALASGVQKMFFHIGNWPFWLNREHGCGFHAFFEYGGRPRKTYVAHNVLAWMLPPGTTFSRRLRAGPRLFAYEFRTSDKLMVVAWSAARLPLSDAAREVLCGPNVEARNIVGKNVREELSYLGRSPVYLRAAPQEMQRIEKVFDDL